jgi:hypothetical protein
MTFVRYSPGLAVVGVMAWLFCGCGGSNSPVDGGTDAGPAADIGVDASFSADTGVDGALDASIDTGVNGQPSLALVEPRIAARQQQTVTFALDAADPEGDAYAVYFTGCANPQGAIQLCIDAGCTQAVTLDCTVVHDDTTVPELLAVDPSLHGRFTAGDLQTLLAGDRYNTAYFRLDDVASLLPPTEVAVVFDVIIDNQPPMVFVQQEDREVFAVSPAFGTDVLVDVTFMDPDFTYSDFLLFTVEGTLDNSLAPAAELDVVALLAAVPDCGDAVTVTPTAFSYTCTAPVGAVLPRCREDPRPHRAGGREWRGHPGRPGERQRQLRPVSRQHDARPDAVPHGGHGHAERHVRGAVEGRAALVRWSRAGHSAATG